MFSRLFWRFIACPHFNGGCKRDWFAFDAMGLSRCMHCHKAMVPPPVARRARL